MGEWKSRKIRDIPLGTRFRYLKDGDLWVLLDRGLIRTGNYGKVAKWDGEKGIDGFWVAGQSVCCIEIPPDDNDDIEFLLDFEVLVNIEDN